MNKIVRIHDKRKNSELRAEFEDLFKLYTLYWLQKNGHKEPELGKEYKINSALAQQLELIKKNYPIAKMAWEAAEKQNFSSRKLYFDWLRQQPEIVTKIENGKNIAYLKVA